MGFFDLSHHHINRLPVVKPDFILVYTLTICFMWRLVVGLTCRPHALFFSMNDRHLESNYPSNQTAITTTAFISSTLFRATYHLEELKTSWNTLDLAQ